MECPKSFILCFQTGAACRVSGQKSTDGLEMSLRPAMSFFYHRLLQQRQIVPKYFFKVIPYFHFCCYHPGLGHHLSPTFISLQWCAGKPAFQQKQQNPYFVVFVHSHHDLFQTPDSLTTSWQNSWIFNSWLPCASASRLKPTADSRIVPCSQSSVIALLTNLQGLPFPWGVNAKSLIGFTRPSTICLSPSSAISFDTSL